MGRPGRGMGCAWVLPTGETKGPTMTDSGGFQVFSLGEGFGKKLSKFLPEEASAESSSQAGGKEGNAFKKDSAPAVWDEDLATSHGNWHKVFDWLQLLHWLQYYQTGVFLFCVLCPYQIALTTLQNSG